MKNDRPPLVVLVLFITVGLGCMFFAIKNIVNRAIQAKDYEKVTGYFVRTGICSHDDDGTTCTLEYRFKVKDQDYYLTSDYSTSVRPAVGSTKTIKYNPINPNEAFLVGNENNALLLFLGFMFTMIPAFFLINFEKISEKFSNLFIGFIFTSLGGGVYYLISSQIESFSLIKAFQATGIFILVPLIFIVVGLLAIMGAFFPNQKKEPEIHSRAELDVQHELAKEEVKQQKIATVFRIIFDFMDKAHNIWGTITLGVILLFLVKGFFAAADLITRLTLIPFLICVAALFISFLAGLFGFKVQMMKEVMNKIYVYGFLLFWFGFLIVMDYFAVKSIINNDNNGYIMLFASVIFWAVGIWIAYETFFKNKNDKR